MLQFCEAALSISESHLFPPCLLPSRRKSHILQNFLAYIADIINHTSVSMRVFVKWFSRHPLSLYFPHHATSPPRLPSSHCFFLSSCYQESSLSYQLKGFQINSSAFSLNIIFFLYTTYLHIYFKDFYRIFY